MKDYTWVIILTVKTVTLNLEGLHAIITSALWAYLVELNPENITGEPIEIDFVSIRGYLLWRIQEYVLDVECFVL